MEEEEFLKIKCTICKKEEDTKYSCGGRGSGCGSYKIDRWEVVRNTPGRRQ